MKPFAFALLAVAMNTSPAIQAGEVIDRFEKPDQKIRSAERGDWKFGENTASCVADPELYKKYKNHGPIIRWDHEFSDATIEFEMKAKNCQRVVFTLNGDGHIFRVIHMDTERTKGKAASRIIAWADRSSKENKGDAMRPKGLPDANGIDDKWTKVRLVIEGDDADLSVGKFSTKLHHAALGRTKQQVTISFADGEFSVRNFHLVSP